VAAAQFVLISSASQAESSPASIPGRPAPVFGLELGDAIVARTADDRLRHDFAARGFDDAELAQLSVSDRSRTVPVEKILGARGRRARQSRL
jgi:hypothetical protein